MDSFYDELKASLNELVHIVRKSKKLYQHNHQPVRFLVDDCIYCHIHGNVLASTNDEFIKHIHTSEESIINSIHYNILD